MAEEDRAREPQKQKAKKAEEPETRRVPGRKLFLKLITAALALTLLGGGGLLAWRHFRPSQQQEAEASAEPADPIGQTYRLDQFTVNLIDPLGRRYLKVQLELEMENAAAAEEASQRNAQIRDSIITLLSSKSYGDVDSPEGKLQLRREIIARVNQFLRRGKAINAYFTDFVIQ